MVVHSGGMPVGRFLLLRRNRGRPFGLNGVRGFLRVGGWPGASFNRDGTASSIRTGGQAVILRDEGRWVAVPWCWVARPASFGANGGAGRCSKHGRGDLSFGWMPQGELSTEFVTVTNPLRRDNSIDRCDPLPFVPWEANRPQKGGGRLPSRPVRLRAGLVGAAAGVWAMGQGCAKPCIWSKVGRGRASCLMSEGASDRRQDGPESARSLPFVPEAG